MQKAVDNSNQRGLTGENAAWYDFQLGELYFNTNQLPKAEAQYTAALKEFDHYYLALAGLGKVLAAEGRYNQAIPLYEKAVAIIPQPDLLAVLGDLYSVTGNADKAESEYRTVEFIGKLQAINQVVYNRLLVLYDANHNRNLEEGLKLAQNELANRKDIYSYDTAAWALYKNDRYAEALQTMQQAMKLGTRDALLYYHAGMIYSALGNTEQAQNMLSEAMAINPHFDLMQARVARETLNKVEAHAMDR
jgi:tetratricopeptide (TPR) repeat protein